MEWTECVPHVVGGIIFLNPMLHYRVSCSWSDAERVPKPFLRRVDEQLGKSILLLKHDLSIDRLDVTKQIPMVSPHLNPDAQWLSPLLEP